MFRKNCSTDMGQRHGRIVRQGNENKHVNIYRYMTERTFDAFLYQTLENKQRFISQIMVEKAPCRSCDDIDEATVDLASAKALCSGDPRMKEVLDLQAAINELTASKKVFDGERYANQNKVYKELPAQIESLDKKAAKLKADINTAKENVLDNFQITILGKEYTDREEAGKAIRQAIITTPGIREGYDRKIGTYRGFTISAFADALNNYRIIAKIKGESEHYTRSGIQMDSSIKATGVIAQLDYVFTGMEDELKKVQEKRTIAENAIEELKPMLDNKFQREAELKEKTAKLAQLELEMMQDKNKANSRDLFVNIMNICPVITTSKEICCTIEPTDTEMRWTEEKGGIEPLTIERHGDIVSITQTYVQNGDLMYDPAITFQINDEARTAEVISYENSGVGKYEEFDGASESRTNVEKFALDWLEEFDEDSYITTQLTIDGKTEFDVRNISTHDINNEQPEKPNTPQR